MIDYKHIQACFKEYTDAYNANDPKIKLKIDHTYRVAEFCVRIAKSISLSQEEVDLAYLCGMLHDIGRFEQVKRYNTFADADSVDHAEFGADLLFLENLYERFMPVEDTDEYRKVRRLCEIAIRNHNKFRIAEGLSDFEQTLCNILRDADKIDILRVNYETPTEDIYNVTTEELKKAAVTDIVKACFDERRVVLRKDKQSCIDHIVGHICLVYELVYAESRIMTKEQGYLYKLMDFESENEDTKAFFAYMKAHKDEMI